MHCPFGKAGAAPSACRETLRSGRAGGPDGGYSAAAAGVLSRW